MSDPAPRRIRAQSSPSDENVLGFVLDTPLQVGAVTKFDAPDGGAPLTSALFAIDGVTRIEIAGATIWVRKTTQSDWARLKPAIAATIRQVLDATDKPLGATEPGFDTSPDAKLLRAVEALLEQQVNPSVAAHGGHIAAERVTDGAVYLRMSGGCQGCAASSATLREGVERMLRAALPEIREIVDVTDHEAGSNPFYARAGGASPTLERPVPAGVIDWQDGQIIVDPGYLAPRLGLTADVLRAGLRNGDVVGVTEAGTGEDNGKMRIVLRSPTRAWAAELHADGTAREIPPPRQTETATKQERALADRVRAHLQALDPDAPPVTYGALARALGLWAPGSVRKITRALETTMQQDARANRPFIAVRAISRSGTGLPGDGFFELARALSRGPQEGESDRMFFDRETLRLAQPSPEVGADMPNPSIVAAEELR